MIDRAYGVWLRAPAKNAAKFNSGAEWLRNMNDGNSTWAKTTNQGTLSTMVYGGNQEGERFMEVDGVVRAVHGDSGEVEINSRDFRM